MSQSEYQSPHAMDEQPHWYVIHCKGGESFRAAEHLANQGYAIFHPVLKVQEKRSGNLVWLDEPLLPHYLVPHMDSVALNRRPNSSPRGVSRSVTFGTHSMNV